MSESRITSVRRVALDPSRFVGHLHRLGMGANARYYSFRGHDGVDVVEEEWDNLLILDGCRFDVFAEQCALPGRLESRTSPASESAGFMDKCFRGREIHDTVYVTANPHASDLPDGTFHATELLLDSDWNEELGTVTPGTVVDAIERAHRRYPDKRLVGHFMQPHFPFIGERGRELDQGGLTSGQDTTDEAPQIWHRLQYGDVDREIVWEAYRENLDVVLSAVEELLEDLPGRTVITSDHGNLVGDCIGPVPCRGYGHPPGLYVPELVEVPWLVTGGERRQVVSEPPVGHDRAAADVVESRLRDLGYTD